MNEITMTKKIDGDSSGSVMLRKMRNGPAPSICADSYRCPGMTWRPASSTMKEKPTECQRSTPMIVGRASCGFVNQLTLWIPIFDR